MDQAKGILAYIQAKHPDKGYDVEGVMSVLVNCDRSPDYVLPEVSCTVQEISTISAKSYSTLFRTILLLKLPPEIQAEIRAGNLPVSQVYLLAANLECPDLKNSVEC